MVGGGGAGGFWGYGWWLRAPQGHLPLSLPPCWGGDWADCDAICPGSGIRCGPAE